MCFNSKVCCNTIVTVMYSTMVYTCYTISQWRMSIGLWACHQISYSTHFKDTPNTESIGRIHGMTIIRKIKDLTFSLGIFLSLFLILSGDIELNPGPETGNPTIIMNSLCFFTQVFVTYNELD